MQRGQLRHDDPHFAAELLLGMIVGLDFERQRFAVPHRDNDADSAAHGPNSPSMPSCARSHHACTAAASPGISLRPNISSNIPCPASKS